MNNLLEKLMFMSRWLFAPVYFGLALGLLAFTIKFFQTMLYIFTHLSSMTEPDLISQMLSLIGMVLVGGLLIMVIFSGYENFIASSSVEGCKEKLTWLRKINAESLKNKVSTSIVVISAIHLLSIFIDLENVPNNKLMWYVIIHFTFVFSALVMVYVSKIDQKNSC